MITAKQTLFPHPPAEADSAPNAVRDFNFARKLWTWFLAPPPSLLPDEWAEKEPVIFNYSTSLKGPCDFTGRNYLRRPIRDAANPAVRKQKKIFGRGNGKTLIGEVKKCFKLKYAPGTRGLCVWPAAQGEGSSKDYVDNRLSKTIEATKCLNDLIPPGGQKRLLINSKKISLNGSYYGFVGSNSGSKGVGNRLNDIDFDEIEKYPTTLKKEGSIINLAEGATKGVADFQIDYSSTPTVEEGLMWTAIQKSNLHVYFLPCPHCSSLAQQRGTAQKTAAPEPPLSKDHARLIASILHRKKNSALEEEDRAALARREKFKGWFTLIFSEQYSAGHPRKIISHESHADAALNGLEIPAATVKFRYAPGCDQINPGNTDAKNRDGTWNHERAMANAHLVCPHCQQAIRDYEPATKKIADADKLWMDAHGCWICVKPGEPGDIGYIINSLYAPVINKESTWGGYTTEFISALEAGGEEVRTFVNAILAGVYLNQQTRQKSEMSGTPISQPDWIPLLTADFHKNHPYIWFVVRRWCPFKLLPPFPLENGIPNFVPILDEPQNAAPLVQCLALIGCNDQDKATAIKYHPAWNVVAELMRFKSGETDSPLIQFLLAQKIVGEKLVKLFKEEAKGNTMDFRKLLHWQMAKHLSPSSIINPPSSFRVARGGDSELLAAGHLDLSGDAVWEELRDIEKEFHVGQGLPAGARATAIDCGFAEKFNRVVLQQCFERAHHYQWYNPLTKPAAAGLHGYWPKGGDPSPRQHTHCQVTSADGWYALRGKPTFRPLGTGKINHELNINIEDAYYGTPEAGSRFVEVLEIPQALFWLRKDDLGKKRTKNLHTISPHVSWFPKLYSPAGERLPESRYKLGDYEKQMNEQYYNEEKSQVLPRSGKGGSQNKRHPYHLDDCETYQIALATHHQFFQRDQA